MKISDGWNLLCSFMILYSKVSYRIAHRMASSCCQTPAPAKPYSGTARCRGGKNVNLSGILDFLQKVLRSYFFLSRITHAVVVDLKTTLKYLKIPLNTRLKVMQKYFCKYNYCHGMKIYQYIYSIYTRHASLTNYMQGVQDKQVSTNYILWG